MNSEDNFLHYNLLKKLILFKLVVLFFILFILDFFKQF